MKAPVSPRLVLRFALTSLAAFLVIAAALSIVVSRQLRGRAEDDARQHAMFVTSSIIQYEIRQQDLERIPEPGSERYGRLLSFLRRRIIDEEVVRVKIWRPDGTIVFSDEPALIGKRFDTEELGDVLRGRVLSEIAETDQPENTHERGLGGKLLETYVPLYLEGGGPADRPDAVVEVYTSYAGIENQVAQLFRALGLTLAVGLSLLYLAILPLVYRVARTLTEQNETLEKQAKWLQSLLAKEQATVGQLREVNRLKGNFIAVASHELRSPLTSIIGYVKTLQRPEFEADAAMRGEFLEAVERQSHRLSQLVENLLLTSQLEDHRMKLALTPISFPELAQEIVESLGPRASRVRVSVAPDVPPLVSDRGHVARIMINLLDNALKYSPSGAVCELGARKGVLRDAEALVFWVQDEGIGIAEDEKEKIFDRFYQVDSSSTRPYGGVGLGLNLVKDLVDILGGTIDLQSEPGRGSTFSITLPLRHSGVSASGEPAQRDDDGAEQPVGAGGRRIRARMSGGMEDLGPRQGAGEGALAGDLGTGGRYGAWWLEPDR